MFETPETPAPDVDTGTEEGGGDEGGQEGDEGGGEESV